MQIAIVREDENEVILKEEIAKAKKKLRAYYIIENSKTVEYFHDLKYTATYALIEYRGKIYTTENRNYRDSNSRVIAITILYLGRQHYDIVKERYGVEVDMGPKSQIEVHQESVV